MAVNELVYVGLAERMAIWFVLAAVLATEFSSTWNFIGNERWAFSGRRFQGHVFTRYLSYVGMNNALLVVRVPMLWMLTLAGFGPAWANLGTLGGLFVLRYVVSDGWVWRTSGPAARFDESADQLMNEAADAAELAAVQAGIHLRELGRFDDLVRLAEQEIELVAVVGAVNPDDGPGTGSAAGNQCGAGAAYQSELPDVGNVGRGERH